MGKSYGDLLDDEEVIIPTGTEPTKEHVDKTVERFRKRLKRSTGFQERKMKPIPNDVIESAKNGNNRLLVGVAASKSK